MKIEWIDEFCVGLDDIDAQHKYFFGIIKKIEEVTTSVKGLPALEIVLEELKRYAAYHFASEERLMETYGFPGLEGHASEHKAVTKELLEHMQKVKDEVFKPSKLLLFLYKWFASHTTLVDQEYAQHVREIRAGVF